MHKGIRRLFVALLVASGAIADAAPTPWVAGYYPGWRQNRLSPADIDFGAVTLLIHFSVERAGGKKKREARGADKWD